MKVTTNGQVTIPAQFREFLTPERHDDVTFMASGTQVVLQKSKIPRSKRCFANLPGCWKAGHTTDELSQVLRLITP